MASGGEGPGTPSREDFLAFLDGIGKTTVDGMQPEGSRTAFFTAFVRAFHSANEHPGVFDDWMAAKLLTAEEYEFFEEMYCRRASKHPSRYKVLPGSRREVVSAVMRAGAAGGILGRARFAEDLLENAVADGIRQYVILGAGLDTFALRRADLLGKIRVIEVDHPGTQAIKRRRLAAAGLHLPSSLHFVPVDFSKEDLPQVLLRSCFDPELPAFFSWLGVTYYLEREHLFMSLRGLGGAAAPRSLLVFDYLDSEAFVPGKATPQVRQLQERVRWLGEPMKAGLDPEALEMELMGAGWRLQRNLSAEDIEAFCLRGRVEGFRVGKHLHLALADLPG